MIISKQNISQRKLEGYMKYVDLIQWGRKNPARFVEDCFGIEFLDLQKYVFMNMWWTPFVLLCQCRNSGKALDINTEIPTPNGYKKMRDIQVGDFVYDEYCNPVEVEFISETFRNNNCYRITFGDGEELVADANHLWEVLTKEGTLVSSTELMYRDFKSNGKFGNKLNYKYKVPTIINGKIRYKKVLDIKRTLTVPTKCISVKSESHLYLCGKKGNTITHNSTISAPFLMAKSILYPNFNSYIISSNSAQAQETFGKIEKIAKQQLASFTGLTDLFSHEIITSNANKDGFTHKPDDFTFQLFNGSSVHTLTSNYDGSRGKRSNCNFYDETGFMIDNAFATTEPFTTQNATFKLGGNIDISLEPATFQNQLIYASSASSVDTYFFKKYKEFSKRMILGDKNYFCADINCDLVLNPMFNGKLYPVALLTQEKIDQAMREDKETAMREYRNIFQKDGGENQPFKRGRIIKNSSPYVPMLVNEGNKKRHIACFYDPARSFDDSVVLFGEFWKDEDLGWRCKIINAVRLVDIGTKKKIPMQTQNQIEYIRNLLIDYNGKGFGEYENIGGILVDSGAGGAGKNIADYFMEDWKDYKGKTHAGLIDKIESSEYVSRYPNAIDKLKLISPKKYRTDMFDALAEMMEMDLIEFTETYDMKGYIQVPIETETRYKDEKTKEDKVEIEVEYKKYKLSFEEELALKTIDKLKQQLWNVYRFDNAEKTAHRYALAPDKINKMHDDLAYVSAMMGWYLKNLRRDNIANKDAGYDDDRQYVFT